MKKGLKIGYLKSDDLSVRAPVLHWVVDVKSATAALDSGVVWFIITAGVRGDPIVSRV